MVPVTAAEKSAGIWGRCHFSSKIEFLGLSDMGVYKPDLLPPGSSRGVVSIAKLRVAAGVCPALHSGGASLAPASTGHGGRRAPDGYALCTTPYPAP